MTVWYVYLWFRISLVVAGRNWILLCRNSQPSFDVMRGLEIVFNQQLSRLGYTS